MNTNELRKYLSTTLSIWIVTNFFPTTNVVNIKANHGQIGKNGKYTHIKYWLMDNSRNVYIGRSLKVGISKKDSDQKFFVIPESKYHNPFIIGKDGDRREVLSKFRIYFIKSGLLECAKTELRGKNLGCWCSPEPCHGHIIKELID